MLGSLLLRCLPAARCSLRDQPPAALDRRLAVLESEQSEQPIEFRDVELLLPCVPPLDRPGDLDVRHHLAVPEQLAIA